MIKVTYEDQLNISTDLIEYLLALIKITNKGSALLQEQVDYSTVSQTIEAIRENICECAQKYRIVKELNPDIFKNLLNCYDLPVCDHKLIQLCDLLLLFKRAESVKFVLETNDRQTLKADEKSFIENVIRAAMGISQQSDAHAIIVSEETGGISVAYRGQFYLRLNAEELESLLTKEN